VLCARYGPPLMLLGMNPRQRRGVILIVISVIGALAIFSGVSRYTASVARQVGPTRSVLELTRDLPAYRALTQGDVHTRAVPVMFATESELTSFAEVRGRVLATPLSAGTRLQRDVLVPAPAARPGEREITVNVGVEASVAAALRPEDRVDVVAAYDPGGTATPYAQVTVSNARVLRVERLAAAGGKQENALSGDTVLAVTFALLPADVTKVVLAQTVAKTLRLALVPRGLPVGRPPVPFTAAQLPGGDR
jgi:pilus assembly protein CpaB